MSARVWLAGRAVRCTALLVLGLSLVAPGGAVAQVVTHLLDGQDSRPLPPGTEVLVFSTPTPDGSGKNVECTNVPRDSSRFMKAVVTGAGGRVDLPTEERGVPLMYFLYARLPDSAGYRWTVNQNGPRYFTPQKNTPVGSMPAACARAAAQVFQTFGAVPPVARSDSIGLVIESRSTQAKRGDEVGFTVTVRNNGSVNAGPVQVRFDLDGIDSIMALGPFAGYFSREKQRLTAWEEARSGDSVSVPFTGRVSGERLDSVSVTGKLLLGGEQTQTSASASWQVQSTGAIVIQWILASLAAVLTAGALFKWRRPIGGMLMSLLGRSGGQNRQQNNARQPPEPGSAKSVPDLSGLGAEIAAVRKDICEVHVAVGDLTKVVADRPQAIITENSSDPLKKLADRLDRMEMLLEQLVAGMARPEPQPPPQQEVRPETPPPSRQVVPPDASPEPRQPTDQDLVVLHGSEAYEDVLEGANQDVLENGSGHANQVSAQSRSAASPPRAAADPVVPFTRIRDRHAEVAKTVAESFVQWCRAEQGTIGKIALFKQRLAEQLPHADVVAVFRDTNSNDPTVFHTERGSTRSPVDYWLVQDGDTRLLLPCPESPQRFKELNPSFRGEISPQALQSIQPVRLLPLGDKELQRSDPGEVS